MKHNGVPRTLRRDIWRLANNQAFIFVDAESGIRSKVESKAGKSRMDRILGLIDWCNGYISFEPSYKNNVAVQIQITVRYCRSSVSLVCKAQHGPQGLP